MKKVLNFSLCTLLALSLSTGNVAATVNATGNNETVDATANKTETDVVDSTTEGEVENDQENISAEETTETQAPEVEQEAKETKETEDAEQEAKEIKETEDTKQEAEETKKAKTTEEKAESLTVSKKTVANVTSNASTKNTSTTETNGINFTIDLDIANKVDTVLTVDGKAVESTKKNVTVDIENLKVTKSNGKKVIMFEDKVFANSGLREYYSLGLPFTDKKQMTVRLDFVVKVNGTKYTIPFEKTYKGSDEDCKAFGYMKIDITKAQVLDAITHTVTFVDHDGTTLSVNEGVLTGTSAVAPANPERTGYTFTGWSSAFDTITGDLTVKAQYKVNKYNVTFVDYDGTQIGDVQEVEYEKAATAPADPGREGYIFTGWDTKFDKITGDVTVTAEYEINKYKVTFVDYDESQIGEVQEVEHGKAATAPEAPTRAGYTFTGWDAEFNEVKGDLTVTAQYEMLPSVLTGTAMFFIVKGDERPKEPASYSSENYTSVGNGVIKQEAVNNDDEEVKAHIIEAPELNLEKGWTVEWYVIKKEADGWHVDGIKVKVSSGGAIDEEEAEPKVTIEPTDPTPETPTGSAIEPETPTGSGIEPTDPTPETPTGSAIEPETPTGSGIEPTDPTPETPTGSGIEPTEKPTATPGSNIPYIPYIGPVAPANTEVPAGLVVQQTPAVTEGTDTATVTPGNTTTIAPTATSTVAPADTATTAPTTDAGTEKDVTAEPEATPDVEIKEDEIPGDVPAESSTPVTESTIVPTEVTATPNAEESITVQDNELPDSSSASDEETDDVDKDAVELEEDDIANSGAETDEEDADEETTSEDESDEETSADTEEIEEDEVASSLPQTGVMSGNVFYFAGSMISALGICILTVIRRKTTK